MGFEVLRQFQVVSEMQKYFLILESKYVNVFLDYVCWCNTVSLRPWLLGLLSELCGKWVMFEIFSNCKNNSRSNTATGASVYVAHCIACLCLIYLVPYEVATIFYPCFTDVKIEPKEGKDTKLLVGGSGFFWLLLF